MILLDTNVLSELMRPSPNESVVQWVDALSDDDVWISAVTVAEIRLGLALLPEDIKASQANTGWTGRGNVKRGIF